MIAGAHPIGVSAGVAIAVRIFVRDAMRDVQALALVLVRVYLRVDSDLLLIRQTLRALRLPARVNERRQHNGNEQGDDGNHDEQFNEGERGAFADDARHVWLLRPGRPEMMPTGAGAKRNGSRIVGVSRLRQLASSQRSEEHTSE